MMSDELPVHPETGLTAIGIVGGKPVWPALGGDGTTTGSDGQGGTAGDGDQGASEGGQGDNDQDGDQGPDGADALGDPGKRALEATKDKWKRERDRRKAAEDELEKLRNGANQRDGGEPDPDEIRREAEKAATARANRRILHAEVKAAAAGKLADPADAARFIDLDQFEVGDDGEIDDTEVDEAISDLLAKKPYLAATPNRRFQGGADGGQGRGSKPKDLDAQIREAEAKGDVKTALALKQRKLTEKRK